MQGPARPAMVRDVSSARPPGALKSKPSNMISAQIFLASGEATSIESITGERSMKSSWIRRLKPRDELELLKGNSAEVASEMTHTEVCQDSVEKMDGGVRSSQPACFSQEKASTKTDGDRARLNLTNKTVPDTERQKIIEQKDCGAVNRQRSGFVRGKESLSNEVGKEIAATAAVLLSSSAFGPWMNLSSGRNPGGKPCLELERVSFSSKNVVGNLASTQLSRQVRENSRLTLSLNNSMLRCNNGSTQGDVITPNISGKPPLPPIRSNLGLPPRPFSQNNQDFPLPGKVAPLASVMGGDLLDQLTRDVLSNGQLLETPFSRETIPVRQEVSVQEEELSKIAEAKHARAGLPFQKPKPLKGSFPDSTKATSKEHTKGDCRLHLFTLSSGQRGNNGMPSKHLTPISVGRASASLMMQQQIGECSQAPSSDDVTTQMENDRRKVCEGAGAIFVGKRSSREATKDSNILGIANLSSDVPDTDLHLKLSRPEIGDPKVVKSRKTALQQSPSESSHGTARSDTADASASTTASLPWEMFIEAAGASKKAREQFVEVYNRARDELKNQRTSQIVSRAPAREMDDGPRLTLWPGADVPALRLERQSLKHQEQSAGHFQSQGRLKALTTSLEHRTQSLGMNLKAYLPEREQHTIILAEGKGQAILPASEQGGVHGDNVYQSNSDSPCRKTESFRKGQILPMELQHRVNLKAPQGSDQDTAYQKQFEQSSDALGQVHNKGVSSEGNMPNEGPGFSSNSAVNHQQLASNPKEHPQSNGLGQVAGSLCQHNDRQEITTPLLGKRPRGTFEDHTVSRVVEKGPIARRERASIRPHIWLQRWHPTTIHNGKGMPGHANVLSDGVGQDSVRYLALGMKEFKDGDGCGVFGRATELKNTLADRGQGLEGLKMRSAKMLPSAAAMAIVGTAARQFCSAQPQRKGSFAFWSGFGMPALRKVKPSEGKGKAKLLSEADS